MTLIVKEAYFSEVEWHLRGLSIDSNGVVLSHDDAASGGDDVDGVHVS